MSYLNLSLICHCMQVKLRDQTGLVPKSHLRLQQPESSATSTAPPTQPLGSDAKTTPPPADQVCLCSYMY